MSPKLVDAEAWVLDAQVSDHLPLAMCWKKGKKTETPQNPRSTMINYKKLVELMKNEKLEDLESMSTNEAFNSLHDQVIKNIEKSKYTASKKQNPRNPWIQKSTIAQGILVDRLRRKFIRSPTEENEKAFRENKRMYQKAIRQNKACYYKEKLQQAGGDSKKIWEVINQVTGRKKNSDSYEHVKLINKEKKVLTDNKSIANEFNNYYINVANDLAKTIEKSQKSDYYFLEKTQQPKESFEFANVTKDDILREVRSFANKSSCGPDSVSNKIIKKIIPYIIDNLQICINKSLSENTFPERIKSTKITPIAKQGDLSDPSNWRPIAQLSPFSKIFEKCVTTQITEFLISNEVLDNHQFGFRPNHSTYHN